MFLVILAHPDQMDTMKSEVGTNGWANMTALCRSQGDNHPIFTGGNVMWNSCIVVEYDLHFFSLRGKQASLSWGTSEECLAMVAETIEEPEKWL